MNEILPSEFFADLRALPLQSTPEGARHMLRRYGDATPLLLVSLLTDLTAPVRGEAEFQAWLDRAPGEEGRAIANSLRVLAAATNATEEVAAIRQTEKAFTSLDPVAYTLSVVALVRMFSAPHIQSLLQDGDELDRDYESFFDSEEGREFKAAVEASGQTPESAA